jgi:hypothetical protein
MPAEPSSASAAAPIASVNRGAASNAAVVVHPYVPRRRHAIGVRQAFWVRVSIADFLNR